MNDSTNDADSRLHGLAVRQLDGTLTAAEQGELAAWLAADAEARRLYAAHMCDTASLRWIFSGRHHRPAEPAAAASPRRRRNALAAGIALALAAGLACIAAWPMLRGGTIATVTAASQLKWADNASPAPLLSRVGIGQPFEFAAGTLELTFDTGAQVKVFGPAKFETTSRRSICCYRGRVKTLVGESGKGFTIDTLRARIVDLGTEFGVNISDRGDTQVVVFQGSVDLKPPAIGAGEQGRAWNRTLEQGEALRVDDSGKAQRLVAIQREDFFPSTVRESAGGPLSATILDVRDNLRDGQSSKCYQIVHRGLWEDAPCFVDRSHQWNGVDSDGIPPFLRGADYVMPFNEDKFVADLRVEVEVAQPSMCYIFLDENMAPPEWLKRDFHDTGHRLGMDGSKTVWHKDHQLDAGPGRSIDFTFAIWARQITRSGVVRLGGVEPPVKGNRSRGFNMYGIAVAPQ